MASVFLSYDRDDAAKARALAGSLEKVGHTVWWDFQIKGGAEYSREIEQALAQADAVIVLWSEEAIQSPWVRDEAAAGRDRGRLVPVRLDEASPPLGFRQYQCIDLRAWNGRGQPPLDDILTAIDSVSEGQVAPPKGRGARSGPKVQGSKGRLVATMPAISILIALSAAVVLLVWQPWRARNGAPLVAIAAAESGGADSSLAADLLTKLSVLQSSHADALQLVEINSRQTPDFIIKIGTANGGKGAHANLMLMDNRADTLLWAREFTEPNGNQSDLRQQMAYSAAQVLDCAVQALSPGNEAIELPTLKLYLSGCADMSNLLAQDPRVAISIFTRVIEQAPEFEGGWKKLLLAELRIVRPGFDINLQVQRNLRKHIAQAQLLDPVMAEAVLAEAWLSAPAPMASLLKAIDKAVAADPDNPEILAYRSTALTNVGLMQEALDATRRAVKANPLSPSARDALIVALLNSGQIDAAKAELEKAEQLWPGATNVLQSRFALEFREGDPAKALQIMKSGQLGAAYVSNAAHETYLEAKINPSPRNKELAIVEARSLQMRDPTSAWVYARALAEFGDVDELIDFLLKTDPRIPYTTTWVIFRPSFWNLHKDPRFMRIAERFGVAVFWRETGMWPDFCARPDLPYDCKAEVDKLV